MNRRDNIAIRNTRAQDHQHAVAIQMITDGIAALPVEVAIGALQSAICLHPDITPKMLTTAGNTINGMAWDMEREHDRP